MESIDHSSKTLGERKRKATERSIKKRAEQEKRSQREKQFQKKKKPSKSFFQTFDIPSETTIGPLDNWQDAKMEDIQLMLQLMVPFARLPSYCDDMSISFMRTRTTIPMPACFWDKTDEEFDFPIDRFVGDDNEVFL